MDPRTTQILKAAQSITKKTPPHRRKHILRLLSQLKQTTEVTITTYYLSLGTVPRSLWEE